MKEQEWIEFLAARLRDMFEYEHEDNVSPKQKWGFVAGEVLRFAVWTKQKKFDAVLSYPPEDFEA